MSQREQTDFTPAVPLQIDADLAARLDDLLREFAEDAELDTALVVDRSGALVTGISSETDVTVEVISALVAGASGAMRALVTGLGDSGEIESLHQGEDRVLYLGELLQRFVLVGVCTAPTLVGVLREKARQMRPRLVEMLDGIEAAPPVVQAEESKAHVSLRQVALESATGIAVSPALPEEEVSEEAPEETEGSAVESDGEAVGESGKGSEFADEEAVQLDGELREGELSEGEAPEDAVPDEGGEEIEREGTGDGSPPADESISEEEGEPREVIELLGLDEPEIVIEESGKEGSVEGIIDSPFEMEPTEEVEAEEVPPPAPVESIFELEEEVDDEESDAAIAAETGSVVSEGATDPVGETEAVGQVFEADEDESEQEAPPIFELDPDEETEEIDESGEPPVEEAFEEPVTNEEEEDAEAPSSGPFYF
jgi:predicted regulator of Ras-like GTPase activity (Roadblock/LC7/MglB family)